eukprot:gene3774-4175_t
MLLLYALCTPAPGLFDILVYSNGQVHYGSVGASGEISCQPPQAMPLFWDRALLKACMYLGVDQLGTVFGGQHHDRAFAHSYSCRSDSLLGRVYVDLTNANVLRIDGTVAGQDMVWDFGSVRPLATGPSEQDVALSSWLKCDADQQEPQAQASTGSAPPSQGQEQELVTPEQRQKLQ